MEHIDMPLVSCIMPTCNRRSFVPSAIHYFLNQDYPHKELVIVDDGSDCIHDIIPENEQVRYIWLNEKMTLGEKRNYCVRESTADLIMHWDDDDWYSTKRLRYQVEAMMEQGTEICGINNLLYFNLLNKKAFQYIYPTDAPVWLSGASMCYNRKLWERNKFANTNIGEDGLFVWKIPRPHITVLEDSTIAVHMIHNANICPKKTDGSLWHPYPVDEIEKILGSDWMFYSDGTY